MQLLLSTLRVHIQSTKQQPCPVDLILEWLHKAIISSSRCLYGRKSSEELILGQDHVTIGETSDLHTATELAQYMLYFVALLFFGICGETPKGEFG
ncbi:hypothetical protein F3Y22_tig00111427pilonHSYRG00211 [Hibiscus syriacus]|uniref:Uncharacterized protein n=1 Tax=Hibiscus syriacus TaxID=106335 RepID=A0A6A2XRC3_HIBSY|nr:hypothetical protein F3Y22_tig00111427pilonHSYRG00211 [Hibiscus syriacus]